MKNLQVSSVSAVIDALDACFPVTTIENLHDKNGNELPIRGVFFKDDSEAAKFGAQERLVVLHSKGEKYYFQSREDAIDQAITAWKAVRSMGSDDIQMNASFNKGYNVSFTQRMSISERKFAFKNDVCFPNFKFSMPYDSASRGDGGLNRIVCSNLLTTRKVAGFHFAVRHTKNMGEKLSQIEAGIATIVKNWDAFIDYCNSLAKSSINLVEFYNAIYGSKPEPGRGLTVWQNRLDAIRSRLNREAEKLEISPTNGWMVYNALQGYLQNDTTRKADDIITLANLANNSPELLEAESLILGA